MLPFYSAFDTIGSVNFQIIDGISLLADTTHNRNKNEEVNPMYIPVFPPEKGVLYMQIYEQVKSDILSGVIVSGDKLPSKRILSSLLGISINTVDAAYQQLVSEGYLDAVPRSGYTVSRFSVPPARLMTSTVISTDIDRPRQTYPALHPDTIDFSPNGIDMASLPIAKIRKTIRDVFDDGRENLFSNCEPEGAYALRSALAGYLLTSRGLSCDPQNILIGAGTDYILQLLVQILSAAHEITSIAMENPVYNKGYSIFTGLSIPVRLISLDRHGIEMTKLHRSDANIVYTTPSHQFPLGIIMPINRRHELLAWASQAKDRYIIEDDYDSEFRYFGRPIPPMRSMDSSDQVIYLGTFSKSIAPSVRISYLVLPDRLMQIFHTKLSYFATTISHPDQQILARFIENNDFERHINRMRTLYRKKRDHLLHALSPYKNDLSVSASDAGLHLLLCVKTDLSESELILRAGHLGVIVYGISSYYHSNEDARRIPEKTILLGYAALRNDEIDEGVNRLARAWGLTVSSIVSTK